MARSVRFFFTASGGDVAIAASIWLWGYGAMAIVAAGRSGAEGRSLRQRQHLGLINFRFAYLFLRRRVQLAVRSSRPVSRRAVEPSGSPNAYADAIAQGKFVRDSTSEGTAMPYDTRGGHIPYSAWVYF